MLDGVFGRRAAKLLLLKPEVTVNNPASQASEFHPFGGLARQEKSLRISPCATDVE